MKVLISLIFLVIFNCNLSAESYYVWAVNGINIRKAPNSNSEIIGKLNYGEKIEEVKKNYFESSVIYTLILEGFIVKSEEMDDDLINSIKNDRPLHYSSPLYFEDEYFYRDYRADIKLKGEFIAISHEGQIAYIYSGFLSKYPVMKLLSDADDGVTHENIKDYLLRTNTLIKKDTYNIKVNYLDDITRYFQFKENVIVATGNSEKGYSASYCFSNLTTNEALLFIYIEFEMWKLKDHKPYNERMYGMRGQKVEENSVDLWFSAPEGYINILTNGDFTIISIGGSC